MPNSRQTSDYNVILAVTSGRVSGVDVFSFNLVRGLQRLGIPAQIVLTKPYWQPRDPMPFPPDIPMQKLPVGKLDSWRTRWRAMIRYLEERAPCIYIPNYDWYHSCVSPKLSGRVGVVGIVHSDDPKHYEHVARLGGYWNAIVAVSPAIARHTAALDPTFASRLVTIPYGVEVPPRLPERQRGDGTPLRIVYAGRLVQEQKRVLDLPGIILALVGREIPVELTIVGGGSEQQQLLNACASLRVRGMVRSLGILPNDDVLQVFEQSDVFILTSDFEGLPVSLLEAMGRGCVPVVTDVRSGIPELVRNGVNGYRVPVGDIRKFAERLTTLQRDVGLRREMASQAYHTIRAGGYRTEDMVQSYVTLFQRVLEQAENGSYHRPRGRILPPPSLTWKDRLPAPVRAMGRYGKRLLAKGRD